MVISEAPPIKSGIARVAERLSQGLRASGHQVDILSQRDVPRIEYGEIRLSSMPFRLSRMRHRFCQYDLIHLHGPVPTFSDIFLLAGLRGLDGDHPPLVNTYHAPIDLRGLPAGGTYSSEDTTCAGALGAVTVDNLQVPPGQTCDLAGTRVQGNVKVEASAMLSARDIEVIGNVQAEGAAPVKIRRSTVGGSV
jgi:hypothetical protein